MRAFAKRVWCALWASDLSAPARRYHRAVLLATAVALVTALGGVAGISVIMTPILAWWLCAEIRSAEWWMTQAQLTLDDLEREIEERG